MRIVILTVGTRGDVEPYLALGMGLAWAGHTVRLATHERFRDEVVAAGLEFAPLPGDPRALLIDLEPDLTRIGHRRIRLMRRLRRTIAPGAAELTRAAEIACRGAEVILYRDLLFAVGYSLAEALGARPVVAALAPRAPTRAFAFPRPLPFGGAANLLSYRLTEQIFWQMLRPGVNRWRTTRLGLPPFPWTGPFADGRRRKTPALYGFSEVVVPRPPDWPPQIHVTGFWTMPQPADFEPPPALVDFLAAGPPPVYVGFGSLVAGDATRLTELVVASLADVGQRGVLVTGWGGLAGAAVPPSDLLHVVEAIPFGWLFPRVAAVVHHGGVGTTAAGLRAGRPSVVVPSYGDMFFWADRVAALGVGPAPIPRRRLTASRLAQAVRVAVTDVEMRQRAAAVGERLRVEDGVAAAVAALTRHLDVDDWRWGR